MTRRGNRPTSERLTDMADAPDPDEMTDAAKAEIAAAVKIVREDKQYAMLADLHGTLPPKADPPPPDGPQPPPPKPTDPPPDPPTDLPKRKGIWWGDQIEDDTPPPKPDEPKE